ncbi:MAG: hypothetical protein BroJett011_73790 [Chloroflexota bacterium]|nr:MAG: hypothetical protein BroJett011_73790 [Chloroflexota bacterium]
MSLVENKAIVRRGWEEIWNKGNLTIAPEHYALTYVSHMPGNPDMYGPEGHNQLVTMYRTAFPDLHFTVEDQIAEGDKVVNRVTARGTHLGEFRGIPPTGKPITVTGITIDRIAGGKLVESWASWDFLGLLQQLGVVPKSG